MIHSYLDLSTSHLTSETVDTLCLMSDNWRHQQGWPAMTVAPYPHGVFITVPDISDKDTLAAVQALPEDLQAVLHAAVERGVYVIRFDADGHDAYDLPTYEW